MAKESTTTNDEHAGLGGSYLIDKDGTRTLVQRTAPATENTAGAVAPDAPTDKPGRGK